MQNEVLRRDQALDVLNRLFGLPLGIPDVARLRIDNARRARNPGRDVIPKHQRYCAGELWALGRVLWMISVSGSLLGVLQWQQEDIVPPGFQRQATEDQPLARHADARAGRINAARRVEIQQRTAEPNIMITIRPRAVQFLIALSPGLRFRDPAQIEPSADHMLKTAARLNQAGAHTGQRVHCLRVNPARSPARLDAGAINPAHAIISDRKGLGTIVLDPHRLAGDRPRLQSQRRAAARRLQHEVGHRLFRAVERGQNPLAFRPVTGLPQKNGLDRDLHRLRLLLQDAFQVR